MFAAWPLSSTSGTSCPRKEAGRVYWGDSNLEADADIRNLADELARQAHAKLLNREWIAAQKAEAGQGYQRAGAVAGLVTARRH